MRITLLFTIFLFLYSGAHAQYTPMLEDGSEWYSYHWFESSFNRVSRIGGDSIIGEATYKKIIFEDGDYPAEVRHLLREDTLARQIFLWRGNDTEIVIYDYSLEVGDTLFFDPSFSSTFLILDSITNYIPFSNYCSENTYPMTTLENPKVFHWGYGENSNYKALWVEGIGNLADLIKTLMEWEPGNMSDQILCHYNSEGIRDYQDLSSFCDDPGPCQGFVLSTAELKSAENLVVLPNPAHQQIQIKGDKLTEGSQLTLFDINGQILVRQMISPNVSVDIADLPAGLIIGVVTTKNGQHYRLKFIKQ